MNAHAEKRPPAPRPFAAHARIVESLRLPAAVLSVDGSLLYANQPLAMLLQVPRQALAGTRLDRWVVPEDRRRYRRLLRMTNLGATVVTDLGLIQPEAATAQVQFQFGVHRIRAAEAILLTVVDLTPYRAAVKTLEGERAELTATLTAVNQELMLSAVRQDEEIERRTRAEAERRSVALFPEQNPSPVLRIAENGSVLYANAGSAPLLQQWQVRVGDQLAEAQRLAIFDGPKIGDPGELLVQCGEHIYSLIRVPVPESGYVNVYGRDVTERERTLAQLRESVARERQAVADNVALLREVHHRVKNNLQMLCDMMFLQMEAMPDREQHQGLQDAYSRVYAIARLHEHLHQSMQSGRVMLRDYLGQLATGLGGLYPGTAVRIEIQPEPIYLDMDRAIHVGLIANELVTNAAKHAFSRAEPGEVVVNLQVVGEHVELRVSDNGKGLPEGFDASQAKSLGLHIVHILAQRLKATVRTEKQNGTAFTIRFPLRADLPIEPRHD